MTLVSSAEETAHDVYRQLLDKDWLNTGDRAGTPNPRYQFLATGDTQTFTRLARRFLGPEVTAVERV